MNIQDIISSFKEHQLQYGLNGDNNLEELYKWRLITEQEGLLNTEAEDFGKEILSLDLSNLCFSTQKTAYKNFAKFEPEEYRSAFVNLFDESIDLQQRITNFISTCKNIWEDKISKNFPNKTKPMCDERLISCFLTFRYPKKYTFYKDDVYGNLCQNLGEKKRKAGQKLSHFYELLNQTIIPEIEKDQELLNSINIELDNKKYIHSMPLIAQTMLWYNLKREELKNKNDKFFDRLVRGAQIRGFDKTKTNRYRVCVQLGKMEDSIIPDENLHYELCFDNIGKKSGHDLKHCFAEIHIESKDDDLKRFIGDELSKRIPPEVKAFEWQEGFFKSGFRINDTGIRIDDQDINIVLDDMVELYSSTYEAVLEVKELIKLRQQTIVKTMKEIEILKQKKQIILQGAPGTGKTYTTAEIAVKLCDPDFVSGNREELMKRYKELVSEKRIAFTTFHQSMDYEEFVEGIKPFTEDNEVNYEVRKGIFRQICDEAIDSQRDKQCDNFKEVWDSLIDFLTEDNFIDVPLLKGNKTMKVVLNEPGTGLTNRTYQEGDNSKWIKGKSKFFNKEQLYNVYRGLPGIPSGGHDNYRKAIIKHLIDKFNLVEFKKEEKKTETKEQNYVLIIDEINRANISKVLGELITLLEADKRIGETNEVKVKLPYSNDEFGVPANLYIIGTMNTADRSVGYIDYAIRRRFAFITIKADPQIIKDKTTALKYFEKVKGWMSAENIIGDIEPDDLMIGHSYFIAEDEEKLNNKMLYEVIPLLREYISDGILNADIRDEINNWEKELNGNNSNN